jgi:hypothetical protein
MLFLTHNSDYFMLPSKYYSNMFTIRHMRYKRSHHSNNCIEYLNRMQTEKFLALVLIFSCSESNRVVTFHVCLCGCTFACVSCVHTVLAQAQLRVNFDAYYANNIVHMYYH